MESCETLASTDPYAFQVTMTSNCNDATTATTVSPAPPSHNDPLVLLPAAAIFPPIMKNITAISVEHPTSPNSIPQDNYSTILYKYNVIAQAGLAVAPASDNQICFIQFTPSEYIFCRQYVPLGPAALC